MGDPLLYALGKFLDRLGLIPFGFEWRNDLKIGHGSGMLNLLLIGRSKIVQAKTGRPFQKSPLAPLY